MNRNIKKVAVLGSGVMGSRIACHFANIGVEVLLLDIVPRELNEKEKARGLTMKDDHVRNRIVNEALQSAVKSNPSPLYSKSKASLISTGNFDDDISVISNCDWTIEVVVERLDIKQQVLAKVDEHRKKGSLVTSNTSGIPINSMLEGRSDDFKKHFCGSHFFNPPRYLQLLEIIPSAQTDSSVIDFLNDYGRRFLGKETVICKDTPAFIANRIGVFSIMHLFHYMPTSDFTLEEIDLLTGTVLGRPKSATFRTCDVVGLDTLVHVANGVRENCPDDEQAALFKIPDYIQKMLDQNKLGSKTGEGFYKKVKTAVKSEIHSLDLDKMDYKPGGKRKFDTIGKAKSEDDLVKRMAILYEGKDECGDFYRDAFHHLFAYVSHRIPEISDDVYRIDDAMRAGFGWELGPFEIWDALGAEKVLKNMEASGIKVSTWVTEMITKGITSFYEQKDGNVKSYKPDAGASSIIPGTKDIIKVKYLKPQKIVWENTGGSIIDLGDGILNLEFHTKMNTIGGDVLEALHKAISMAEESYQGLVIYNEGQHFSAGANVGVIFMLAIEQDYDEMAQVVKTFQDAVMRIRYSSIPVVIAPHGLTLGGGCEMCLHADKVVTHAETYMGLVEFGIGVIPGGGGTKEFAVRLSDELKEGDIRINTFRNRFLTVGQAKVSTSGEEAFELGYLRKGLDEVIISRKDQLAYAKQCAKLMAEKGYSQPAPRNDINVLGVEGLGIVYVGANSMRSGNYISDHDQLISEKLGYVMSGGDLSEIQTVSEQYLLDLERKAFVELCGTRKTLERLEHFVKNGKILRN
ncbi:MAG: 3-hydroxyacyl-CoA dehydrogenase/enoyl-CoA hydratase family protein [Vicingaceae bacterium]